MSHPDKPTVLFVDDEEDLLAGLRQSLRKQRKVWNMEFACGAQAALDRLQQGPVDVITTDMRMPGMNGAELLERVSALHPATIRFVLSGEASQEQAIRAIPFTHQWMSKPCERDVLITTIERSLQLVSKLETATVRQIVGRASSVGSAPESYRRLLQAFQDPNVEMPQIAAWIEGDPALAGRVLQLTNSSFFGARREITNVREAVALLGLRLLSELVLVSGAFSAWTESGGAIQAEATRVAAHSRDVAEAARIIAGDAGIDSDSAIAASLLHDIGYLVLLEAAPKDLGATENQSLREAVELELGCTHELIGGAVLQNWGLPLATVEAVTHHHQPRPAANGVVDAAGVVHLANALVTNEQPDSAYLDSVGGQSRWDLWSAMVGEDHPGDRAA